MWVALLALAAQAQAYSLDPVNRLMDGPFATYQACVLDAAKRFAPSGEAAPVVAAAAVTDCAAARRAMEKARPPEILPKHYNDLMVDIDNILRNKAQLAVVRMRAAR